jgi:uncharacterized membrane protein YgcG
MSDSEELARKERRRRLIERLDEKEKLLGSPESLTRRGQMSEEELETEIERERNYSRRGFPQIYDGGGGDFGGGGSGV